MRWSILFLVVVLLAGCGTPSHAPSAPVVHGTIIPYASATIQTVSYLGWWAEHNPRAWLSVDNYAALAQTGITHDWPVWAYIALQYIKTLRHAIALRDARDVRVDGAMIQSWARLLGAT